MSVTAQNFRNFTFALYNRLGNLEQMLQVLRTRHEARVVDAFINTIRENDQPNFGNLGGNGNLFPIPKDVVRTSTKTIAFVGDAGTVYANPMIIVYNRANGQFYTIDDQRRVTQIPDDTPIRIWGFNHDPYFGVQDMDVAPAQVPPVVQAQAQIHEQQQQQEIIDAPDYLIDLVTTDFFVDPVTASDGITYQRKTAQEMIRRGALSAAGGPLTGPLYPNQLIKRAVNDFKQNYQQVHAGSDRYRRRGGAHEPPQYLINPTNGQLFENPVIDLAGRSAGRTRQSSQAQRQIYVQTRKYPGRVVSNMNLKKAVQDYKARLGGGN